MSRTGRTSWDRVLRRSLGLRPSLAFRLHFNTEIEIDSYGLHLPGTFFLPQSQRSVMSTLFTFHLLWC